ncbi:hypothetical protein Tco_0578095 [Tanacetum coccineum]
MTAGQPEIEELVPVLPLLVGGIVSFVTSVSRSTTLGEEVVGIVGPLVENLPLIYLEFKELGLDKRKLDKQEVKQHKVDRFDLDKPRVGKIKLD